MTPPTFDLQRYIIDEDTYERMHNEECAGVDTRRQYPTYEEFIDWNNACYNRMSRPEQLWIDGLCARIRMGEINLMDSESCAVFQASRIYFNSSYSLCIVNPR